MIGDDITRKLTSRKFWMAVAAFVSGLLVAFGETAETAESVAGLIMAGASVLGYLFAEGLTDAAVAGAEALVVNAEVVEEVAEDKE